jgi:dienelactone hydrolase
MKWLERKMTDIQTREVFYSADGLKMKAFLAWDDAIAGQRPGVLVVHEFWGLNDYAKGRAEMLAKLGYTALAVDMYGEGKVAESRDEAGALMTALLEDLPNCRARFAAALELLKAHNTVDENRIGAIGYCMGGGIVLHMARYGMDLGLVASFHGSLPLVVAAPGEGEKINGRVVAYNGEADVFVPAEAIAAFKAEMVKAGADYQFINLPGALHGFSNPEATAKGEKFNMPLKYDELADQCSWAHLRLLMQSAFAQS